jgi:hypothetical protein
MERADLRLLPQEWAVAAVVASSADATRTQNGPPEALGCGTGGGLGYAVSSASSSLATRAVTASCSPCRTWR